MLYMLTTREQKIYSAFHLDLKTFSTVSAGIWNAVVKFNVKVSLSKFEESLKQYMLSNILIINYPK